MHRCIIVCKILYGTSIHIMSQINFFFLNVFLKLFTYIYVSFFFFLRSLWSFFRAYYDVIVWHFFVITFFITVKHRVAQQWVFTAFEKQSRLPKMLIVFLICLYHTCCTGNEQPNMISRSHARGNLRCVGGRQLFYFLLSPPLFNIHDNDQVFSHVLPTLIRCGCFCCHCISGAHPFATLLGEVFIVINPHGTA